MVVSSGQMPHNLECMSVFDERPANENEQQAEIIAYLRDIEADIHAIRVEIDRAKAAVHSSKNPIIRSLFPWL